MKIHIGDQSSPPPIPRADTDPIHVLFLLSFLARNAASPGLTGVAGKARSRAVLIGEVFAAAADGLGAVQGHKLVRLARAAFHSARNTDRALLGKHLIVCLVLFVPKTGKVIAFIFLLVANSLKGLPFTSQSLF